MFSRNLFNSTRLSKFHSLAAPLSKLQQSDISSRFSSLLTLQGVKNCQRCFSNIYLKKLLKKLDPKTTDAVLSDRQYFDLTVDNFKELIDSEEKQKQVQMILNQYEQEKYETGYVPSNLTIDNMKDLLSANVHRRNGLLLRFLAKELNQRARRLEQPKPLAASHPELEIERAAGHQHIMGIRFNENTGAPLYGEWLNSHFLKIHKSDYLHSFDGRFIDGCLFGQKMVIDCDYELDDRDVKLLLTDLQYSLGAFRSFLHLFNIMLTGPISKAMKSYMPKYLPGFDPGQGRIGLQMTEKPFHEVFPASKLIYLTPYATDTLKEYDDNAIYVLGGLPKRLSGTVRTGTFPKIKRLKLKSLRFPLEQHFVFKTHKGLTLKECFKIMGHFKESRDIGAALKFGVEKFRYKTPEEILADRNKKTQISLNRVKRNFRTSDTVTNNSNLTNDSSPYKIFNCKINIR